MLEVTSDRLGQEPVSFGDEAGKLSLYDGLETPFAEDVIRLTPKHVDQVTAFACAAATVYGDRNGNKELTLAQTAHGVPALVTRVDCTIVDGDIKPYELEDSPSGLGVTHRLFEAAGGDITFRDSVLGHYQKHNGGSPHVVVSHERNHGTDDKLFFGPEHYTHNTGSIPEEGGVIVKGIPGIPSSLDGYRHLQERALAPMLTEGDKSYLLRTDNARRILSEADLYREPDGSLSSQVVKAAVCSMAMGVSVHLSPDDKRAHGKKGTVTATRLQADINRYVANGGAIVQPFLPAICIKNPENRGNAILRMFVLLERGEGNTIAGTTIGGCLVARPENIVHGAANSVAAAVMV